MDMSKPKRGLVGTDLLILEFMQPVIGVYANLSEEETEEILHRQTVVAQRFAMLFTAVLADPSYLVLFGNIMRTAAEMLHAEMTERMDAKADKIREQLEDDYGNDSEGSD